MVLTDFYERPLLNLRVAITRKCNLRCQYCHMEGEEAKDLTSSQQMTSDEIVRIVSIIVRLGVTKVKLTGGEPLLRDDLNEIVEGISALPSLEDLSMTTNGTLLGPSARKLRENGLKRVNINFPTLDAKVYDKLTKGRLEDAVEGVRAAVKAWLYPVKLNVLMLKNINDHDLYRMIDFARENRVILQLIELEQLNISNAYYSANHTTLDYYEKILKNEAFRVETRRFMQNRHIYHLPDLKVEIVRPSENKEFCDHCTRIRLTSDGKLKPCLMKNDNMVNILEPMRNGANDQELGELVKLANNLRKPYNINCACPTGIRQ